MALKAVITADASQMANEFRQVESLSRRTGESVRRNFEGGGHSGQSGIFREFTVLIREMANGNFTRVPGSLSILFQRLAAAANMAIGPLGAIVGILAGIGIGAVAAYKLVGELVEKLSGLKLPEFHPEYLAKHLRAVNAAAEGQKEINREILKTVEHYNSVAEASKRVAETTKAHFEHLRKMNSFERSPARKAARELEINQQERQAELANKYNEKLNLEIEARQKKKEADAIANSVPSKAGEELSIDRKASEAKAAQKYLDELTEQKNGGMFSKRQLFRAYNKMSDSNVSDADIMKAEADRVKEAHEKIKAFENAKDAQAKNDELREREKNLTKQAGDAASKAAELGLSIPELAKKNAQADKDEAEEAKAAHRDKMVHGHVNQLQQLGAFAPGASNVESLIHKQLKILHGIKSGTDKIGGGGGGHGRSQSEVNHG